jgi:hypothetical protein
LGAVEIFGHISVHSRHVHLEHEKGGVEPSTNFAIVPRLVVVSRMIFMPFQVYSKPVGALSFSTTLSANEYPSGLVI